MDNMARDIHWMKSALAEWQQAMQRGEETNALIEKYCRDDEKRAELLEVKRRSIQTNIAKQRGLLLSKYDEQKSLEQVIDRTAKLYRQTHADRRSLVDTWKEAVQTMSSRERDIHQAEENIETARLFTAKKELESRDQTEFLEQQIQNNKEAELAIMDLNSHATVVRSQLCVVTEAVDLQSNEVLTMKKFMQNLTNRLQQMRQKYRAGIVEREKLGRTIEDLMGVLEEFKTKLQNFGDKHANAQDRLKHLNDLFEVGLGGWIVMELFIESNLCRTRRRRWQALKRRWVVWVGPCFDHNRHSSSGTTITG